MLQMPLSYLCVKEWLGKNKNKNLLEDMYVEKHIIIDDLPFAKVRREWWVPLAESSDFSNVLLYDEKKKKREEVNKMMMMIVFIYLFISFVQIAFSKQRVLLDLGLRHPISICLIELTNCKFDVAC